MSDISQFMGGGGKLRYQDFTSSGTFTPSALLLARGGQCLVILIGGGGAGGGANNAYSVASGGDAGQYRQSVVTVSGAVSVTIGAGGTGALGFGNAGGNSTFGALLTATGGSGGAGAVSSSLPFFGGRGGNGAASTGLSVFEPSTNITHCAVGGAGIDGRAGGGGGGVGGNNGLSPGNSLGRDGGGNGQIFGGAAPTAGAANTGGGGGGVANSSGISASGAAGGSGFCRVIWFE